MSKYYSENDFLSMTPLLHSFGCFECQSCSRLSYLTLGSVTGPPSASVIRYLLGSLSMNVVSWAAQNGRVTYSKDVLFCTFGLKQI
jgi:hypothetical protein